MAVNGIPEAIAEELISRLEAVTLANGYSFNVASVERVNRDGHDWTPKNNTLVVVQREQQRNEAHDYPGNPPAIAYELPFAIHCFVVQSDFSGLSDAMLVNRMAANVQKAIAEGSTSWHTFGGNAYNAMFGTITPFVSDQGDHAGCTIELTVQYRVSELDPFTVR